MLDGDQRRVFPECVFDVVRGHKTVPVHGQVGDLEPALAQAPCGVQNRKVFDGRNDEVFPFLLVGLGGAFHGKVVRLGSTGGEIHFLFSGAD